MANLYWASLYSRFSTECIVWFQKRDIRQVSSGWKKYGFPALSANLLTPPAHRLLFRKRCKQDSVFMSACRGERYPPWFGKREGISFSLQSHAIKSNQTLRRKPFWRPWPWLNWPSLWRCYGWLDDSSDKEKMVQCVPVLCCRWACIPSSISSCLEQGGPDLSRCKVN